MFTRNIQILLRLGIIFSSTKNVSMRPTCTALVRQNLHQRTRPVSTKSVRGVTNEDRLSLHLELVPKFAFIAQHRLVYATVRLLQDLDRAVRHIVDHLERSCRRRPEREVVLAFVSERVDGGRDEPFRQVLRRVG